MKLNCNIDALHYFNQRMTELNGIRQLFEIMSPLVSGPEIKETCENVELVFTDRWMDKSKKQGLKKADMHAIAK